MTTTTTSWRQVGVVVLAAARKANMTCTCRRTTREGVLLFHQRRLLHHFPHHDDDRRRQQQKQQRRIITFLTDVEGDRDYLTRFVRQSKVLQFRPCSPRLNSSSSSSSSCQLQQPQVLRVLPTASLSSLSSSSFCHTKMPLLQQSHFVFPYDHCIDFVVPNNNNNNENNINNTQYDYHHFVYGGDVWDQGGSDLYVIRQLLDIKARYPDQVHFVMGNRDVNKMRFLQEMSSSSSSMSSDCSSSSSSSSSSGDELPPFTGVYFLRNHHHHHYCTTTTTTRNNNNDMHQPPVISKDPIQRLQWILRYTMGSPRAFAYRQWELQQQQQQQEYAAACSIGSNHTNTNMNGDDDHRIHNHNNNNNIDPLAVVESYQTSTHPVDGEMSLYLAQAKLVVRLGNTLFLHGALPLTDPVVHRHLNSTMRHDKYGNDNNNDNNHENDKFWDDLTFAMPWLPPSVSAMDVGVNSMDDWFQALNQFAFQNVQAFREGQMYEGIWSEKGGYFQENQPFGRLIQYGMGWLPNRQRNPSVVYNSWCHNGMPRKFFLGDDIMGNANANANDRAFSKLTADFFRRTGLELICSGHQPQGDMPNPIRIPLPDCNRTSWILSCDTSYSGDTNFVNLAGDPFQHHNPGREKSRSGRGMKAVSEVVIEQCIQTGNITNAYYHGVLSDGSHYKTRALDFSPPAPIESSDKPIMGSLAASSGFKVPSTADTPHKGRWWTRAEFDPSETDKRCGTFLITTGEGFDTWNRTIE